MTRPANPHRAVILRRIRAGEVYQRIADDVGLTRQQIHQYAKAIEHRRRIPGETSLWIYIRRAEKGRA